MPEINFPNRTLAIMDNLTFLKTLNSESIDLIAMDPPFAANETFKGKPKKPITREEMAEEMALAAKHGVPHNEGIGETRVDDMWRWDDFRHEPWLEELEETHPDVAAVVRTVDKCATENEAAYIAYMAARLLECHRVLKDTGSIYIHCDDSANAYLRMIMGLIFGHGNFRNEIAWKRQTSNNAVKRGYGRITDYLLFYTKSDEFTWNPVYHNRSEKEMKEYRRDERGLYKVENLTTPSSNPARQFTWRGATPSASRSWKCDEAELEAMLARGEIELGRNGNAKLRGWKRYLDDMAEGQKAQSIWTDILRVGNTSRERTGYKTQKPVALYGRIVEASSNEGDVVLDLFCGCATTLVAAENLKRRWLGCDMAYRAWTMIKRRFYEEGYALSDMSEATPAALGPHQRKLTYKHSQTIGPGELPERDPDDAPEPPSELRLRRPRPKSKWSVPGMRRILAEAQGVPGGNPETEVVCAGCGRVRELPEFHLDHILPKKDRGTDDLPNRILLCGPCNLRKADRFTLAGLVQENHKAGWTPSRSARARAAAATRQRAAERVEIEAME